MNQQYDDTNRGQFWRNEKKETPTHPDWKGSINVEGVEYWLSAWNRKPDANPKAPSVSISIQRKDQQAAPSGTGGNQFEASQKAQAPDQGAFIEDDLPFDNPYKHREYLL